MVISNCIECILCSKKEGKKEGFLYPINKEPVPLDTFHMDHLGPMPSTNKNYAHILAIIDAFTKFTWLFPVKSTTAAESLQKLKVITNIFGNPKRIITDKGTAFTANVFEDFCREENIELRHCTTGVPRGNGQIERIHRIVIASLSKLSINDPEKWFLFVSNVQKVLNSTHQRAVNTTPFQLMFGTSMKSNDLADIKRIIEEEVTNEFNEERNKLRTIAKEQILKIQEENRRTFNKRRKAAKNYDVDDLVAISKTQFSTGAKLKPKNFGPYKVTKVKQNDRYEVEKVGNIDGPYKTSTSVDNMVSWASINMIKRISPEIQIKSATVFIEGNIGAGKSTLLNFLAQYDFIKVHQEPVNRWQDVNGLNLLNMANEDPTDYAFLFQLYALLTMVQRHVNDFVTNKINVMERSIFSVKECFMQALIKNNIIDHPFSEVFNQWFGFLQENFPVEPPCRKQS